MRLIICVFMLLISSGQVFAQKTQTGPASYYGDQFEGKSTASGEPYKAAEMTAAHPKLPFQTKIRVTNLENNRSVIVRVNDRGPYVKGRIVDVSKSAAIKLDFIDKGVARVKIEVIKKP